jgi:hypothetical protein
MFLSAPELTSYNHADDLLDSIYLDPHDRGGNFEDILRPLVELKSHHLGVKMNYQGWDPSLRAKLTVRQLEEWNRSGVV